MRTCPLELPQQFGSPTQVGEQAKHLHRVWLLGKFASLIGCLHMLVVFRKCKFHMHAMMQTRMQKVEKFFVFFITKLGLLQIYSCTCSHTQVVVAYRPPLPERHAKTHSSHLAIEDSTPWTQQVREQDEW